VLPLVDFGGVPPADIEHARLRKVSLVGGTGFQQVRSSKELSSPRLPNTLVHRIPNSGWGTK
jgi:hypothetical protein